MEEDKKILVIYVGVAGVRSEDIPDFVKKVSQKISPRLFNGEIIIVPTQTNDTKVECINPKYITEEDLIEKNMKLMRNLNEQLQHQTELLKKKKNEKN